MWLIIEEAFLFESHCSCFVKTCLLDSIHVDVCCVMGHISVKLLYFCHETFNLLLGARDHLITNFFVYIDGNTANEFLILREISLLT